MTRALILTLMAGAALQAQTTNPQNIRQYQLERQGKAFQLVMKTVPRPTAAAGQVRCH
jgi:hypothetical protein